MRLTRYIQSLFAAAALAAPLLAAADPRYAVTAIAGPDSVARDINNLGQVVGVVYTGGVYRGYVYGGGVLTDIGTLGGAGSWANAINDHGQIVGNAQAADGASYGFLYSGGAMNAITGGSYMQANGINNGGTIVGSMWVDNPDGGDAHPYTLSSGGTLADLGTLPSGDGGYAYAVNSHGDVVGAAFSAINGAPNYPTDPFIYHDGVMTGLGNLGGPWSGATSINDQGQVVGFLGLNSLPGDPGELYPTTAFLYANGEMNVIGGLAPPWSSLASDINNLSQVVGSFRFMPGLDHGFLYENGEMIDLNTLIDPASGWTITDAAAINDLQQIAAQACRGGVCQAVRLDLVSAVPEPPVFALMVAGLALGLARGKGFRRPVRRRRD